ncbi:histidine kinase [Streptomyces sp. WI04-05B]|uniref:sensor histidine kinase n=1 Tax=Streptomyces TaxID=1883 RepID=UPI0029A6557C|nr:MULTISPECIES: histidine kinase [unclassified Streptomyces]MDX2549137.1 histidine kinase [Streptomyces sp. WI04-05B]MDX2590657.1 histidine kinase [Streptomyces sp. WI04-05A]
MNGQDLEIMTANALTGVRALFLLLRWPVLVILRRDPRPAVKSLVARQHRMDTLTLGPGEPESSPDREVPWLLCQAVLGPGVLVLSILMWIFALLMVSAPLWWKLASRNPVPRLVITIDSTRNAIVLALFGLLIMVIAAACSHGLPRWHAGVNRLLNGGLRRSRLTRRIAVLTESRAGALEVQASELRRIERDLHDGTQARLVAVSMLLGLLDFKLAKLPTDARKLVGDARQEVGEALRELRELVRGVYPPILADRGLAGGIESLAEHAGSSLRGIAVMVDVPERLPVALESAVYFVVAESLTNVKKHSGAGWAEVTVRSDGRRICIDVRDDGRGGADERRGTGLAGLRRRVAAFDGDLSLASPVGGPTLLHVELPCAS